MDKIEKLFRKIHENDRQKLFAILTKLISGGKELRIKKLQGSDFFRVKSGRFRIIFHYEKKEVVVDSIKLRNEKTYK